MSIDKKPLVNEIIVFECTIYIHDFIEGEWSIYTQGSAFPYVFKLCVKLIRILFQ